MIQIKQMKHRRLQNCKKKQGVIIQSINQIKSNQRYFRHHQQWRH